MKSALTAPGQSLLPLIERAFYCLRTVRTVPTALLSRAIARSLLTHCLRSNLPNATLRDCSRSITATQLLLRRGWISPLGKRLPGASSDNRLVVRGAESAAWVSFWNAGLQAQEFWRRRKLARLILACAGALSKSACCLSKLDALCVFLRVSSCAFNLEPATPLRRSNRDLA